MSVSKTILIGNLGGDPESKYFGDGTAVTNFSLATTDNWKDKQSGERKSRTEWHRVTIVGKLAEIAAQYLKKGSKVYIEGENRTREWEKDGIKRYTTEVHVGVRGTMQVLDSRGDGQGTKPAQPQQQRPTPKANAQANMQPEPNYDGFDDDIPF